MKKFKKYRSKKIWIKFSQILLYLFLDNFLSNLIVIKKKKRINFPISKLKYTKSSILILSLTI